MLRKNLRLRQPGRPSAILTWSGYLRTSSIRRSPRRPREMGVKPIRSRHCKRSRRAWSLHLGPSLLGPCLLVPSLSIGLGRRAQRSLRKSGNLTVRGRPSTARATPKGARCVSPASAGSQRVPLSRRLPVILTLGVALRLARVAFTVAGDAAIPGPADAAWAVALTSTVVS
jgi:hypothetical protein